MKLPNEPYSDRQTADIGEVMVMVNKSFEEALLLKKLQHPQFQEVYVTVSNKNAKMKKFSAAV
jgi:hypothetical protein